MDTNKKILKIKSKQLRRVAPPQERNIDSIDMIVLHHSACINKTVEEINEIHIARGFSCIGYHYYIRRDGDIYIGRPITEIGAHCKGHNSTSVGICLEGDFRYLLPSSQQLGNLKRLLKDLRHTLRGDVAIRLHRELSSTLCPVRNLIWDLILYDETSCEDTRR